MEFAFHLHRIDNTDKKCLIVSISAQQLHMRFTHSLRTYDGIYAHLSD